MNTIPAELKKEILNTLDASDLTRESSHGENTLKWVLIIKPEASLALKIAALGHDIERGIPPRYRSSDFEDHAEYKRKHSERGAEILGRILTKHGLENALIEDINELVKLHEVGGTEDADVLQDADSISFFDNNLDFYYGYKGPEGTKKQIEYKFNRCSPRAQKYIEEVERFQFYKKKLKLELSPS